MKPQVAILTGGGDRPYALGLAQSLLSAGVSFDFIGSNELESPDLHGQPLVRFLNLRGDQNPAASPVRKFCRVLVYYVRLLAYAVASRAPIFHLLWNNKFEYFDRTLVLLFYRLCGKRLVFTAHNVNIRKRDGRDSWLNRFTLRIQYRLVSHIFVHTEKMRGELLTEFSVAPGRISVIPFGINSTVPDTDLTSTQARQRLGLEPGHKVALFFGNIAPYKGLEYLLDAAAHLAAALPELRLLIAGRPKGEPEYWAQIDRKMADPALASRIVARIEYVPDAETEVFFKAADVFVLPYTHVFQSGVLFLGYNFGLPVIASDVGSLKEDILPGRTGLICRPGDADDLARCLGEYFAGDLFRSLAEQRAAIRAYATEHHSWDRVAEITREVYLRLKPAPSDDETKRLSLANPV